jgi:hypothetical protein
MTGNKLEENREAPKEASPAIVLPQCVLTWTGTPEPLYPSPAHQPSAHSFQHQPSVGVYIGQQRQESLIRKRMQIYKYFSAEAGRRFFSTWALRITPPDQLTILLKCVRR